MAIVVAGELVLDQEETIALLRNLANPDPEVIRRRNRFLRNRDDICFNITSDGIIAECNSIDPTDIFETDKRS